MNEVDLSKCVTSMVTRGIPDLRPSVTTGVPKVDCIDMSKCVTMLYRGEVKTSGIHKCGKDDDVPVDPE